MTSASFAASAPAAQPLAVSSTVVAPQAVVNLGLSNRQAKNVQCWLRNHWGYTGQIDGLLGTNSWKAEQRGLRTYWGYTGQIDGIVGTDTRKALQRSLVGWGYSGAIDGDFGPESQAAFKRFANATDVEC